MPLPQDLQSVVDMKCIDDAKGKKILLPKEQKMADYHFKRGAEFIYDLMCEYERMVSEQKKAKAEEEAETVLVEL